MTETDKSHIDTTDAYNKAIKWLREQRQRPQEILTEQEQHNIKLCNTLVYQYNYGIEAKKELHDFMESVCE